MSLVKIPFLLFPETCACQDFNTGFVIVSNQGLPTNTGVTLEL